MLCFALFLLRRVHPLAVFVTHEVVVCCILFLIIVHPVFVCVVLSEQVRVEYIVDIAVATAIDRLAQILVIISVVVIAPFDIYCALFRQIVVLSFTPYAVVTIEIGAAVGAPYCIVFVYVLFVVLRPYTSFELRVCDIQSFVALAVVGRAIGACAVSCE